MKNYSIDKFRTISTIMVIIIHSTTFINSSGQANALNYYIYRRMSDFGVVFFFAASGYFIAQKNDAEWIKNKFLSSIKIYLFATFSYLILNIFMVFIDRLIVGSSMKKGLLNIISNLSLVGFLNGEMLQTILWYLPASAIAYYFYYCFKKYNLTDMSIAVIVVVLYAILSFSSIELIPLLPYGGFNKGVLSMAVGYLAYNRGGNYALSLPLSVIILFIGAAISLVEYSSLTVFILLSAYFALCYCKFNYGKPTFFSKLSENGLSVYLFHIIWIKYITYIFQHLGFELMNFKLLFVVSTISVSYLLSPILYKLMNYLFTGFNRMIFLEKTK